MALARALRGHGPIYGFIAGLDAQGRATTRMTAMTDAIHEALRRIQPSGPYLLVGNSFGGWLALDLANRLTEAGERVAFVGVLDADGPGYPVLSPKASWQSRKEYWRWILIRNYRDRLPYGAIMQYFAALGRRAKTLLLLLFRAKPDGLSVLQRYWLLTEASLIAKRRAKLRRFEGRLTLFKTESPRRSSYRPDDSLGWKSLSGKPLQIIPIAGRHGDHIREQNAASLAAALISAINAEIVW